MSKSIKAVKKFIEYKPKKEELPDLKKIEKLFFKTFIAKK